MAAKKLTRKEIVQEDVIRKTLTETSHWAIEHFKYLAGGVGLLLVLTVLGIAWKSYSSARNEAMQTAFADALEIYHAPVGEENSETPDALNQKKPKYRFDTEGERDQKALTAFQAVVDQYPGDRIGQLATYYLGLSYYRTGETEEAKKVLRTIVDRKAYPDVTNLARNILAQYLLGEQNYEEAATLLEQIIDEPSDNFPRELVLMRLGQTLEAQGDLEGALERFRQVSSEFSGSPSATEASNNIKRLEPRTTQASDAPASEGPLDEDQ